MTEDEFYEQLSEVADENGFQICANGTIRCWTKEYCECPIIAVANHKLKPQYRYWNGDPEGAARDIGLDLKFAGQVVDAADEADMGYDAEIREKLLTAVRLLPQAQNKVRS